LRSFDAGDASFFLDLLPGPRDKDGLPESLRFWKRRVEEAEGESPFRVGLLYGPSGCGKSSLVKAGLLPRLAGHVVPVYVEAASEETEARLLKGLAKACPDLDPGLDLVGALSALRRGQGLAAGSKVLLVLDQLEQWLHARRAEEDGELTRALRQCDGARVQALLLVRDDFWMAVTRFFARLEVPLEQHRNSAAVDLFDPRHALRVLTSFGQAFGALPDEQEALTPRQSAFLAQAVAELGEDGRVIPVRLALFAEMVKGKPWEPETLRALGGIRGVGVTFLEETFSARSAPPAHRLHQQAARAVLGALLPGQGTDLKGNRRSRDDLLAASGYAGRSGDFAEVLRILDAELRLITPTDPAAPRETQASPGYQLTHDYLVPGVREWLTRKQKETRRGRAELRLAELTAWWESKPEGRRLPTWWEWLRIRLLTRRRDYTPTQRRMMGRAARHHLSRAAVLVLLLLLAGWGVFEALRYHAAATRVNAIATARIADVPRLIDDLQGHRRWGNRLLRPRLDGRLPA
jgi:hypothetical protein